jgi:hypothetical protein
MLGVIGPLFEHKLFLTATPHNGHTRSCRQVDRSLRQVARSLKSALKELNRHAAKRLGAGDYASAESFVTAAKAMDQFRAEVAALGARWKEITTLDGPSPGDRTPLWQYYQPILKALVELGGSATRQDLERALEKAGGAWLRPGDAEVKKGGVVLWKIRLRQARGPLKKEGFIESEKGKIWKITARGRRTAEATIEAEGRRAAAETTP